MKLFAHFIPASFANIYLLGPEGPGEAVLIDPGIFDTAMLRLIEDNGYYINAVLVTHNHQSHVQGLKTLLKIYRAQVYAAAPQVVDIPTVTIQDKDLLRLAGLAIEVIGVQGHSRDSVMFKTNRLLFTGDSLSAGRIGEAQDAYSHALLVERVKEILASQTADTAVLPGHGPPSTVGVEKGFNPDLSATTRVRP